MKSVLLLSLLAFSASAFACPELKGTYDCGNYKQTIEQYNEDGADIYILQSSPASEVIIADGVQRIVENSIVKARCEDSQLIVNSKMGIIKTTDKYSLDVDFNLVHKTLNVVIPSKKVCKKI